MKELNPTTLSCALLFATALATPAFAQDAADETKPTPTPSDAATRLDAATPAPDAAPAPGPAGSDSAHPAAAAAGSPGAPAATTEANAPPRSPSGTIADKGGLFHLGLDVTPKIGGALGSILLPGAGLTPTFELEAGWLLPLPEPLGRDVEIFTGWSYAGPSATSTENIKDARIPGGSFTYTLNQTELVGEHGVRYRIPIGVDWLAPHAALALRTVWSNTVVDATAGGKPFGKHEESAFDLGAAGAVGADFFLGPGAIDAELDGSWTPTNHTILANTSTVSFGLAVGYRFFL